MEALRHRHAFERHRLGLRLSRFMEELEPFRQYFSKFREKQFRRAGLGLQFFKIRRKPAPETIFRRHFNEDGILHFFLLFLFNDRKARFPLEACPLNTWKF